MQPLTLPIPSFDQTYAIDIDPANQAITVFAPFENSCFLRLTYTAREILEKIPAFTPPTSSEWSELHALKPGRRIFIHLSHLRSVGLCTVLLDGKAIILKFPNFSFRLYEDHLDLKNTIEKLRSAFRAYLATNPSPTRNSE